MEHPVQRFFFFPLTTIFIIAFVLFLVLLFFLIQIGLISYAYERLGLDANLVFPLLLLSLLGSAVNIPISRRRGRQVLSQQTVDFFGIRYVIPVVGYRRQTVIAVNVGGAIVPTCISLYLLFATSLFLLGVLGIAIVTVIVHRLARPVPGVGIAVPLLIPPLLAAATGLILSPSQAPALAYISGTMGCLIGADLLNLDRITDLGAPVASIGGAGTFDGIFFTGIMAVLLT